MTYKLGHAASLQKQRTIEPDPSNTRLVRFVSSTRSKVAGKEYFRKEGLHNIK